MIFFKTKSEYWDELKENQDVKWNIVEIYLDFDQKLIAVNYLWVSRVSMSIVHTIVWVDQAKKRFVSCYSLFTNHKHSINQPKFCLGIHSRTTSKTCAGKKKKRKRKLSFSMHQLVLDHLMQAPAWLSAFVNPLVLTKSKLIDFSFRSLARVFSFPIIFLNPNNKMFGPSICLYCDNNCF